MGGENRVWAVGWVELWECPASLGVDGGLSGRALRGLADGPSGCWRGACVRVRVCVRVCVFMCVCVLLFGQGAASTSCPGSRALAASEAAAAPFARPQMWSARFPPRWPLAGPPPAARGRGFRRESWPRWPQIRGRRLDWAPRPHPARTSPAAGSLRRRMALLGEEASVRALRGGALPWTLVGAQRATENF